MENSEWAFIEWYLHTIKPENFNPAGQ